MAGGRSTRPAVISKSHFNSNVSNCMCHHTLRCRATKLCQGGCMTRISHADFPLPSSLWQAFGFQFSSVPLCVLSGENWVLTFSVSPCLRGRFAFRKGVIE